MAGMYRNIEREELPKEFHRILTQCEPY